MSNFKLNNSLLIGIPTIAMAIVIVVSIAPDPIDWTMSFSRDHQKPFGNSILYETLPELFQGDSIHIAHSSIHQYIDETLPESTNYLIINQSFTPDIADITTVFDLLENGNDVFIAAQKYSETWLDTFQIELNTFGLFNLLPNDSVSFNLANRKLSTQLGYWYKKAISDNYFTKYDTTRTTVLGLNNQGKTNFIRINQGNGHLYIHLNPLVFTNYNLLVSDNYQYACKCLSYLPNQNMIWDEYYKVGKQIPGSLLGFIFARKPLLYAWYLFLAGVLLFFIFESSRKQRIIPIIKPLENSTVNFVETIGRLYFSRKNHLDIARKKYAYFLEFIRTRYYITTADKNSEMFELLADKSGIPVRSISQLFNMGERIARVQHLSEEDLEQLNRRIEYFYDHCN